MASASGVARIVTVSETLIRMGILGISEGNGHPYSWSAIINGYNPVAMERCPYPGIVKYLAEQRWPDAQLPGAQVTHIWTQDDEQSRLIADASRIGNVVSRPDMMFGEVDAVLLARDDSERHYELASPFLRRGIPVYVDKPVSLSLTALDELCESSAEAWQLFSCSALRFAKELVPTSEERKALGRILHVEGSTPKSWEKYAVHLVDPVVTFLQPGPLRKTTTLRDGARVVLAASWASGLTATFTATGESSGEIALNWVGTSGTLSKVFRDSFSCFREALAAFIHGIESRQSATPRDSLANIVEVLEAGMTAPATELAK